MLRNKILVINPGSTSTKVAVFENEEKVFSREITHTAEELAVFADVTEQLPYRQGMIEQELKNSGIKMEDLSAVVARCGSLNSVEGGVYRISDLLRDHAIQAVNGVRHPAMLGASLARHFADLQEIPAYIVNPPETDELCDLARMTGIKGVYRSAHLHALNLKETAIRHAELQSRKYEDCNFIVCHIGGGISVSAHRKGKMIDGNEIIGGEGPMTPTRCGSIPVKEIIELCYSGKTKEEVSALCTKSGGFVSHFGTSDAREVVRMVKEGDRMAFLVWNAMLYQIEKNIGAMASVLHGEVDGILLGGGMVFEQELVEKIEETCGYIAPVYAYPGEFEMEALAAGVLRVLSGKEQEKKYTGEPVWNREDFETPFVSNEKMKDQES